MIEALGVLIGIILITAVEVFALIVKDKMVKRKQYIR
jgi:hypothetical protein